MRHDFVLHFRALRNPLLRTSPSLAPRFVSVWLLALADGNRLGWEMNNWRQHTFQHNGD
jgi:hypothetical protein